MTVYKSPTCGCCAKWVEHIKKAGFAVTVKDMPNVGEVKAALAFRRSWRPAIRLWW